MTVRTEVGWLMSMRTNVAVVDSRWRLQRLGLNGKSDKLRAFLLETPENAVIS